jgi:VIT1/CCC1 family predicted Fe2+/Mn2+ transporter
VTTLSDPDRSDVRRYASYWTREVAAAWLFRELAAQADADAARTLERLAQIEDRHAAHWAEVVNEAGGTLPRRPRLPLRERAIALAGRHFGVERVLPMLIRLEAEDAGMYEGVDEALPDMTSDEVELGRVLSDLGDGQAATIASRERRHRAGTGGALRAATFGVNDGLVSNLALVMGVAGGSGNPSVVLLAGVAGLIAGALSMAAGEWVSVQSQRELYEREIEVEREELKLFPDEEREELQLIMEARGIPRAQAITIAGRLMAKDTALDTLVREELGLDPDELGNPWIAAGSSFVSFAVGASVPVLPFVFLSGAAAMTTAVGAAGAMLLLVGAAISIITGRSALWSGLRMLAIGGGAAAVTYGIGSAVGIAVG